MWKVLILLIYKELLQIIKKEINTQIEKWAQDMQGALTKGKMQIAKTYVRGCPVSTSPEI